MYANEAERDSHAEDEAEEEEEKGSGSGSVRGWWGGGGGGRRGGSDAATSARSLVFFVSGQDGCAEGLNCSVPLQGLLSIVLLCLM